jgi:hypothetical protein
LHFTEPSSTASPVDYDHIAITDMPWTGTLLRDTFNAGSYDTINLKVSVLDVDFKLMLDLSQLEVVAFIQDEGYGTQQRAYSVLQAAYSPPLPVINGMGDVGIRNVTQFHGNCMTQVQPQFMITNYGTTLITSVMVSYTTNKYVNINQYTWTGSLQSGDSALVSFAAINLPAGADSLTGIIQQVNGQNTGTFYFNLSSRIFDFNVLNNFADPLDQTDYLNLNTTSPVQFVSFDDGIQSDDEILAGIYLYRPIHAILLGIEDLSNNHFWGSYRISTQSIVYRYNYYNYVTYLADKNSIFTVNA